MPTDCLGAERLIGDIFEGSGDLCSIVCLLGGDKAKGMIDVFSCKFVWATRGVFGNVGTVL